LAIVLSVLRFTVCNYPYSIFKLLVIVLFVPPFTVCNYPYSIFKLLAIVLTIQWPQAWRYYRGNYKL
jgi:ABC-type dipeptide/oligopeptide/nickel transport system permease subunit